MKIPTAFQSLESERSLKMIIDQYIDDDPEVRSWWENVEEKEKNKLLLSWSPEGDSCRKTYNGMGWEDLPIIIVGKLTDKEENKDWNSDLYDFFVNHPEFFISGLPICFHVCTSEQSIRNTLKNGIILKDFLCSGLKTNCIMKPTLENMKSLNLVFKAYKLKRKNQTLD